MTFPSRIIFYFFFFFFNLFSHVRVSFRVCGRWEIGSYCIPILLHDNVFFFLYFFSFMGVRVFGSFVVFGLFNLR